MDPKGLVFPCVVLGAALLALWWHVARARRGAAGSRDRWMSALWAAIAVLAGWRVVALVADDGKPDEPAPPSDAGVVK
jgi:hypothetical protein